jgi:hypothetical protein
MKLTFWQSVALDIGSCLAMIAVLYYADSPWWVYLAVLVFGTCQRMDAQGGL